jgi:DNA-binding NtrC family response regulator
LPAAVLLDIDLPDGSGLDVLRAIKDQHYDAIVIMITGNVHVENTISALRGGAYDFVGKPINLVTCPLSLCFQVREYRLTKRNSPSFDRPSSAAVEIKRGLPSFWVFLAIS